MHSVSCCRILLAGILFLLTQVVYATDASTPLTLDVCIEEALQKNPALNVAQHTEVVFLEDVGSVKGRYYPELLARTGYRRWETHAFLPSGVVRPGLPSTVGPINDWQANLRATYTIFDSGLRSSELKAAEAHYSAAQQESVRTRADIVYAVNAAFYELLAAEDNLALAKARQQRGKDHLLLASERKASGAVPKADVTRAQVEVSSIELQLARAESAVRIARGGLNEAMGRMPHQPLQIIQTEDVPQDPSQTDINEALAEASGNRPEIHAAESRVMAKRRLIGAARSEILPKLRVEGGYGWRDDGFVPQDRDWWVGLTFDIPLFDGGSRSHKIAKSKAEVSREQAQLDRLKLSIQQEVWSAYSSWVEAHQALKTGRIRKEEADENLRLTRARYQEGADTIYDLLDAEFALNEAEIDFTSSEYRVYIARAVFLRAAGRLQ